MTELGMLTRWMRPLAAGVAGVAVCAAPAAGWEQPGGRQHARARLISEHESLIPGTTAWLGLSFEIDDGWHLYWKGLNDSGFPIQAEVKSPEGYAAGEMVWPAPVRYPMPGDMLDHIYEKRVTLLIPVQVPASVAAGSVASFTVEANWLVCQEACLPGSATVKVDVPVGKAGAEAVRGKTAALFDEARALVPKKLSPEVKDVAVVWGDGALVVTSATKELAFYPAEESAPVADLIKSGVTKEGKLTLRPEKAKAGSRIVGVVEVGRPARDGKRPRAVYWVDFPIGGVTSESGGTK